MAFMFEKLQVCQKAVELADKLTELTEGFPRGYCKCFLVDQLNRAALSIPANIAEGNGRFTKADRSFAAIPAGREDSWVRSRHPLHLQLGRICRTGHRAICRRGPEIERHSGRRTEFSVEDRSFIPYIRTSGRFAVLGQPLEGEICSNQTSRAASNG